MSLDYAGTLTATYPAYENGWTVTAEPDGTLYDENGDEYSYLFWEGENNTDYDFSKGFCVAGADTADFLREKLAEIGLTPREYNEFIVYWLPKMQDNPYNLISFQSEAYTDTAKLDIDPTPDSVLRVFMAWKPLSRAADHRAADIHAVCERRLHRRGMGRLRGEIRKEGNGMTGFFAVYALSHAGIGA